jgi:hypothetical protein
MFSRPEYVDEIVFLRHDEYWMKKLTDIFGFGLGELAIGD